MSKRNRNKFRARDSINRGESGSSASNGGVSSPVAQHSHTAEYRIISADLIRLVVLNAIMLALVLVIYFTNLHSGYLEKIFLKLFKI